MTDAQVIALIAAIYQHTAEVETSGGSRGLANDVAVAWAADLLAMAKAFAPPAPEATNNGD